MQILVLGESSLVGVSIYHQMLGGGGKGPGNCSGSRLLLGLLSSRSSCLLGRSLSQPINNELR